jgi:hypothetical protein
LPLSSLACVSRLEEITKRDPEQEVRGIAIPVVDAVINGSRAAIPDDDEVGRVFRDLIDPDAVAAGGRSTPDERSI